MYTTKNETGYIQELYNIGLHPRSWTEKVRRVGRPLNLTTVEFKLLGVFAKEPGGVFSRTELAAHDTSSSRCVPLLLFTLSGSGVLLLSSWFPIWRSHNSNHAGGKRPSKIVCKPCLGILDLIAFGSPQDLPGKFNYHPHTGGTNRVPEALKPAVRIDWEFTLYGSNSLLYQVGSFPMLAQVQVLVGQELVDTEAIMDYPKVQLLPRVLDTRLLVC
jgi:hypothetical protein